MKQESFPVTLAKESLRYYIENSTVLKDPSAPVPPELTKRAGVFVSLKKQGRLRGCIGTILPTQPNAAQEIIRNAICAATEDPRFDPVTASELDEIEVSVDILTAPERIDSLEKLDPKRFGVIVRRGSRSGVLLPDLEGVDTAADQVAIASGKAGIRQGEPVELYRFEVIRYH